MDIIIGLAIGIPVGILMMIGLAMARAGGLGKAIAGFTIAGRANQDPAFAAKLQAFLGGAEVKKPEPPKPVKPSGAPLRMLALLQAESRLVDFLLEDIQGASDEQIGQAVREIHKKAQAALKQHAVIEQVLPGKEDDKVTVQKGFDPSAVRVVGNVTGEPPFSGTIQHPGWRVKELKLATPPAGADEFVLQPAEVQIS
ncbi:DUF2760 domain-containing protein [Frigoriglobus tundricola]|uniref:DUF2760 domain-containing protein n=1 Tax=Frigoriglobus tundricola TaxID=2774151 RepID=A0A6M5YK18_9BACT|nr:DUF2760 domain-containing protein [Frigoriglobus tundricola]QJW94338.1 hypothetical protein FTUN_1858 [Frigoriglobus tundricola]